MKKVCFVCTANACRSQMAEGLAKKWGKGNLDVYSAGSHPLGQRLEIVVLVMKEAGLDITDQFSKSLEEVPMEEMDYVITLCDSAANHCPTVSGKAQKLHWPIDDPFKVEGTNEEVLKAFRNTRDEIERKIKTWLKTFN